MRVNNQAGFFALQDTAEQKPAVRVSISGSKMPKKGTTAIFMGGLFQDPFDPIEQRRASAQKKAYKIVQDAFAREQKIDNEMQERSEHAKQLRREKAQSQRQIQAVDDQIEELRQAYGVDKDSKEQKDLETLQNLQSLASSQGADLENFQASAEKMYGPLTEYQKRALELNSYKQPYERAVMIADRGMYDQAGIYEEYAVIRGTSLERLKHTPMLDAVQEAEDVLAAASEEIIGMLIDEAKDHIDEKQEEEQEKAEERREEKEEEQEKLEETKEHREELEALLDPEHAEKEPDRPQASNTVSGDPLTENLLKMEGIQNEVRQEIEEVVQKMNLVAEDLKGIRVDESI